MKRLPALLLLASAGLLTPAPAQTARPRPPAPAPDGDPSAAALRIVRRIDPDEPSGEETLVQLTRDYLETGRVDEARRFIDATEDAELKAFLLVELSARLLDANRSEEAAEAGTAAVGLLGDEVWLDDWGREALRRLTEHVDRQTYDLGYDSAREKSVVARLVGAGRRGAAAEILGAARAIALDPELTEGSTPVSTLVAVAALYAEIGEGARAAEAIAEAAEAARRVEEVSDRADALCLVAKAHVDAGRKEEADRLLGEALEAGSSESTKDHTALREVARLYARLGMKERARAAALAFPDEEDRVAALAVVERVERAASGRPADVAEEQSVALDAIVAEERGDHDKWFALSRLLRRGVAVEDVLGRAASAARALDDEYYRAHLLCLVGDGHEAAGRREEALRLWDESLETVSPVELRKKVYGPGDVRIERDGEKVELLRALGKRFLRTGETARLTQAARAIESNYWQALTVADGSAAHVAAAHLALAGLAEELLRGGRREDSLELLAAAARVARHEGENNSPWTRAEALATVASVYARAGERATAGAYFLRALQTAAALPDDQDGDRRAALLSSIGRHYAQSGLKPDARARRVVRRIVRDIESDK